MRTFLKSKIATVVLLLVLAFVMVITARILMQKRTIDNQIAALQAQVDRIKRNNEELTHLNKYFETPEYQEKQAREKLNLRKDGELVVVLPNQESIAAAKTETENDPSNIKQWFNYFFDNVN